MSEKFPILSQLLDSSIISHYQGQKIDKALFLQHINCVRALLPDERYCINLCEDRYLFLLLFVASISKHQTSLLPNSRAEKELQRLNENYPDNYQLSDEHLISLCFGAHCTQDNLLSEQQLVVDEEHLVVIVFTSGTTGKPKANSKTWKQLLTSAQRVKQRFLLSADKQHSLVATVPAQHMFGFETTIIFPLLCGVTVYSGRPFFPLDIQQALAEVPAPRIFITIPLHLKNCCNITNPWPEIDFIISATAPMPPQVAIMAEQMLSTNVMEIYGCSEVGAIATRQLTQEPSWQLLDDFNLVKERVGYRLIAPAVKQHVDLPDQLEIISKTHFNLIARQSDMINVGGKRGSLEDLSLKLKMIDGVDDAIFISPDDDCTKRSRLVAFAVSSSLSAQQLRQELALYVDAVFLPRPLIILDYLPYNESGKLPRRILLELLQQHLKIFKQ